MAQQNQPTENKPDFNEEMRRWMAKQSFWNRMLHSRGGVAPRFWKILIPALALAALVVFITYARTLSYLAGPDFKALAENEAAKAMGFDFFSSLTGKWENGELAFLNASGDGLPESWIRGAKAGAVKMDVPFMNLIRGEWGAPALILEDPEIELRSGLLNEEAAELLRQQQSERAKKRHGSGGEGSRFFGIGVDAEALRVSRIHARGAAFLWGGDSAAGGELRNTRFQAARDGDIWTIDFEGGVLSIGWLKQIEVDRFTVRIQGDKIAIEEGSGRFLGARTNIGEPDVHGVVGFSGEVRIESSNPFAELKWTISETRISRLLREPYASIFSGSLSGEITMNGNINDAGGLTSRGNMRFDDPFSLASRALDRVGVLLFVQAEMPDLNIPHIPAREGGFNFVFDNRSLKIENLDWRSAEGPRMEAAFQYDVSFESFDGVWMVGFPPQRLDRRPVLEEKVFTESRGGLLWMRIPLQGPLDRFTDGAISALRVVFPPK